MVGEGESVVGEGESVLGGLHTLGHLNSYVSE